MKKAFNIIAAHAKNRGIGLNGKLPWSYLKKDMERFIKITRNTKDVKKQNAVIMGRRTWDSMERNPLKDRLNVILSKNLVYTGENIQTYKTLDDALEGLRNNDIIENTYIIGGSRLYEEALKHPKANKLYLTEIDNKYDCDVFFPEIPKHIKLIEKDVVAENLIFKTYQNKADLHSDEYNYLNCLDDVLYNGEYINDRTGVGTLSLFNKTMEFDIKTYVSGNKFSYRVPAMTTKNLYVKGVILELLWFLQGRTDSKWLEEQGVNIWKGHTSREFLDSRGLHDYPEGELGPGYGKQWIRWGDRNINQIKYVINTLREDPTSRRALINAWNVSDLNKMALVPCHVMYMFKITDHNNSKKLNCSMIMRSNDLFLGAPFNILSTSILTVLISKALGVSPGKIAVTINDAHIYSNHVDQVKEQLERVPLKFPVLRINKDIESWNDMASLEYGDFEISEYFHHSRIKADMAI